MNKNDIDKAYISLYDKFLLEFDMENPKSESQLKEIKKHKRIAELRDAPSETDSNVIWEDF
ncbi:MAG: hypothetical protein P1U74_09510 [Legionellaceae bacterium]|nr:hypothetical protein [Legionellaceae bacterium]